jgi:hypothetical protein
MLTSEDCVQLERRMREVNMIGRIVYHDSKTYDPYRALWNDLEDLRKVAIMHCLAIFHERCVRLYEQDDLTIERMFTMIEKMSEAIDDTIKKDKLV